MSHRATSDKAKGVQSCALVPFSSEVAPKHCSFPPPKSPWLHPIFPAPALPEELDCWGHGKWAPCPPGLQELLSPSHPGWGTASFLFSGFPAASFTLTSVHSTYQVSQHGYPVWPCSHYFLTEIAGRHSYFRKIWTKRPKILEIKKHSADTQANKGKQTPWLNWGGTGQRYRQRIQLSLTRINK